MLQHCLHTDSEVCLGVCLCGLLLTFLGWPFACVRLICWARLSPLSGWTHGDLGIRFFGQCSVELGLPTGVGACTFMSPLVEVCHSRNARFLSNLPVFL